MTNIQTIKETQDLLAAQISHLQKRLFQNQEIRHDEIEKNPGYVDTYEYSVLVQEARTMKEQINAYTDALYALGDLKKELSK